MAMTKQLYSINALATELGRDRRTISSALAKVKPDGKSGRWDAWYLATAIEVLQPKAAAGGTFPSLIVDRLRGAGDDNPPLPDASRCSVSEFARASSVEPETVLQWLKAGMPFLTAGDWKTGEGFILCFGWAADWTAMLRGLCIHQNDPTSGRNLNLL